MSDTPRKILRFADVSKSAPTALLVEPSSDTLAEIARDIGADKLRKTRFQGQIRPMGKTDWEISGSLGATVTQACVVTLDPVVTCIEEPITRRFVANFESEITSDEVEMPEDDTIEPLVDEIDLHALLSESLALAIPAFPRSDAAQAVNLTVTEPGKAPLKEEDLKPFAGLAKLKETLQKGDDN